MVERYFNTIEEQVKALHSDIELYRCDYDKYGVKRIVIRFPAEKNEGLKEFLSKQGWKREKEEYISKQNNYDRQIKGWIPNETGRKYLRMSFNI